MHLYVAFLGGSLGEDRMGEDHEVVMIVAEDRADARDKAKAKWRGPGRSHVDALQRIDVVDGFQVDLVPTTSGDRSELYGYND
jgi:hypothetical protein